MSNVPPPPGGGFPPPPSGPPPGGGFPPPPGGPPGGGFPPPPGGGFTPPGGGGYQPPGGGGGYQPGGFGGGAPGQLAEWQDRLMSGVIDFFAPYLLGYLLQIIGGGLNPFAPDFGVLYIIGSLLQLGTVAWALYNGYLAGSTGQSIGMKQSGLRLVSEVDGQLIGGNQGLVRNLLFIPAFCCCNILLLVDNLFPLWDPKKQTLRDKIGKSVVIKV